MSALDQALEACLQDESLQDAYYETILGTDFFVPLQGDDDENSQEGQESVQPLILASDNKHYMMLFDSEERLNEWAKEPTQYAVITGQLAAEVTPPGLHWAVNIGSGFAKEFVPEEIDYLKNLPAGP